MSYSSFHLRINFFISENKIVKFKKFVICLFGKWKFPKFNDFENLYNLEKLSNTSSVQVMHTSKICIFIPKDTHSTNQKFNSIRISKRKNPWKFNHIKDTQKNYQQIGK